MSVVVYFVVTPHGLAGGYRHVGGNITLPPSSRLTMEAVFSSETLTTVDFLYTFNVYRSDEK
jgi:hypothetical protein